MKQQDKDIINKVNEELLNDVKVEDSDYANGVGEPIAINNHLGLFDDSIKVESVLLNKEDNQIEVVMRQPSSTVLLSNPPKPSPDKVWKNVFAVNDEGKIYFKERVDGTVIPQKVIPETIEFKKS